MAEASFSWAQDQFSCPVCLDLLKDPATIPCGHSYCMSCITRCWNREDQKGVYSCPQCRQAFTPRPALGKNTILVEMVNKLKKTKLQASIPAHCYAGPGDVECDICTERKHKAVKSCVVCLNSFCHEHLEQHEKFFKDKKHNLINATGRLQKMICSEHDRLLEVFCCTDQQCICMMCLMDKHKNHETEKAAVERTEKQRHLVETQRKYQERIQEREKELQKLREAVKSHKHSTQAAVEDSEKIFTDLIRSIEKTCSEVTQLIRDQEKAALSQAKGHLERLEQEIADLKRKVNELEQLSHTDDHIHFLQNFQSLSVPLESTDITFSSLLSFDDAEKSVTLLKLKLEDFCKEKIKTISGRVKSIQNITTAHPKTRKEFLQYYHQFTLDPNTAYKRLRLSEGNKVATYTRKDQPCPDHPDRFDGHPQALCEESVCGRSYWEVERGDGAGISVSYKSISRKGRGYECVFGYNDQSWSLICSPSRFSFIHKNIKTKLSEMSSCSRIGVYVDHTAGSLSFYSVSDTMTLIHRVQTTFTQPLYPGFYLHDSIQLCDIAK